MKYTKKKAVFAGQKTVNLAGGEAYTESAELEFVSVLLTSFLKDQFYRTEKGTTDRLTQLLEQVTPLYAAKAAVLARRVYGMRSVTHFISAQLANKNRGTFGTWGRKFFRAVIRRPDDALEIFSAYQTLFGKKNALPHALRNGIADALHAMTEYEVAKYAKWHAETKLVDLVNLTHPKYTEPLSKLVKGSLSSAETWEVKLTQTGGESGAKTQEWSNLILTRKLGYFALLRNLRNILENVNYELIPEVCTQLLNETAIRHSLVLPFRFMTALNIVETAPVSILLGAREIAQAIVKAVDISLVNVPQFPGRTCVVVDTSSSMGHPGDPDSAAAKGILFAAALYKTNHADLMVFSNTARYVSPAEVGAYDALVSIARRIPWDQGGTNFRAIFPAMRKAYDRVIILSDNQGWIGYGEPGDTLAVYRTRFKCSPKVYVINLCDYGTLMFPESNVYVVSGWSEKIFDTLRICEEDPHALINRVNAVNFELPSRLDKQVSAVAEPEAEV